MPDAVSKSVSGMTEMYDCYNKKKPKRQIDLAQSATSGGHRIDNTLKDKQKHS
jgi:hypothetical protein